MYRVYLSFPCGVVTSCNALKQNHCDVATRVYQHCNIVPNEKLLRLLWLCLDNIKLGYFDRWIKLFDFDVSLSTNSFDNSISSSNVQHIRHSDCKFGNNMRPTLFWWPEGYSLTLQCQDAVGKCIWHGLFPAQSKCYTSSMSSTSVTNSSSSIIYNPCQNRYWN